MRTEIINGNECIFDTHADARGLYITSTTNGRIKKLRYRGGYYAGKYYSRVYTHAPENMEIDHINGNPLDNRKVNLRLVTRVQNMANKKVMQDKRYGLPKGVYKGKNGYQASLCHKGRRYSLGQYSTISLAEAAYKKKAEELHGKYAVHISRP